MSGEPVELTPRGSASVDDEVSDAPVDIEDDLDDDDIEDDFDDDVDAPARCWDCNKVLGWGPWLTRPVGLTRPICDSCARSWEDLLRNS